MNGVEKIINQLVQKYLDEYPELNSPYDINNGYCCEFAEDVLGSIGLGLDTDIYTLDNFRVREKGFDRKLLSTHWMNVKPTHDLSWDDFDNIDFGHHEWIHHNDKHYDAECPKGVLNFFELPLFDKYVRSYLLKLQSEKGEL